jgi:hypothetical protein
MTPTEAARIIFDHMTDIDGDEADWLYFREMLEEGAKAVLDATAKFDPTNAPPHSDGGNLGRSVEVGPLTPTQEQIEAAKAGVRDEYGSHLCAWKNNSQRVCRKEIGAPCLCEAIGLAALTAAAGVGWPSEQLIHDLVDSATEEDRATQRPAAMTFNFWDEVAKTIKDSGLTVEQWCEQGRRNATAGVGETTLDHIARDIRSGIFPKRSEPLSAAGVGDATAVHTELMMQAVAATIERCAQAIREWTRRRFKEEIEAAESIISLISDLKDKP